MLNVLILPPEHAPGRDVIGSVDPGDGSELDFYEYEMIPSPNEPPDPVRPSAFNGYKTENGTIGSGYKGNDNQSTKSLKYYINPFAKHGQRDYFNENTGLGKPPIITDNRGRVLDGRTQFPGQKRFRFNVNIPKPSYMSFSDLVDLEGVS